MNIYQNHIQYFRSEAICRKMVRQLFRPKNFILPILFLSALLLISSNSIAKSDEKGNNHHGSAHTGKYRNLFSELGYSKQTVSKKIQRAYQQLFNGDSKNQTVYYSSGKNQQGNLAYIFDVNSKDVRSEGMSYGMMIAVQMNKKEEFDSLWNWSKTYMYHDDKKHPANGFFSWSVKTNGEAIDEMPAPDGEAYFVTALYFASVRWGNGEDIYNYSAEADQLLNDMRHRKLITGETNRGEMTAGNLFHPDYAMTRFTPDVVNAEHTDPSYHLPAFYEVWAKVGPKVDRSFWKKAATASRRYFLLATHPKTALAPEYGNFDGSPWRAPWHNGSGDFRYDAWRTTMNWSVDWAWWAVDNNQKVLSDRLQAFFSKEGMDTYASLYTLSGKKLNDAQTTGIVAMNATASLAATKPAAKKFVQALWNKEIPSGQYRYYDGMLYMMALLHCSGEFKAWLPE